MFNRKFLRLTSGIVVVTHVVSLIPAAAIAAAPPPGVTSANGNTQVYLAPNGVPVVNIANPNAAGVSHNQYTQYNVDSRGVVLNNGTVDQLARQSQLAGQTLANVNLSKPASLVLNEVVSPNRSTLAGYTEVLGQRADVIVANPYGITCSGCGFINTDRVSLTTGTPRFGSDGALSGFTVTGGDVLISGAGLDGRAQSYFDIVTRALRIDGQLNAQTLNVLTGPVDWEYGTGSAELIESAGTSPAYAIDSTVLGGIYADRIHLVANEAGVGVRMRGEVAATADDFRIDSAGRIELLGRVSAQSDLTVDYFGAGSAGSGAITVSGTGASLTAGRDVTLVSNDAGITLEDGALSAGGALSLAGASLTDSSTTAATRFGARSVDVNVTGTAGFSGSAWSSGNDLSITAGSVSFDGAGTSVVSGSSDGVGSLAILAQTGDLDVGLANIRSPSTLFLGATEGSIHVGAESSPIEGRMVSLAAGSGISNAGVVLALENLFVSGALDNTGSLQGTNVVIGANGAPVDIRNAGTILGDNVYITAADLRNSGRIQAGTAFTASAASFENESSGVLLTATDAAGVGTMLVSGALENAGSIHSAGTLAAQASTLHNALNGEVSSGVALQLAGTTSLVNEGAIQAEQSLQLFGVNIANSGNLQSGGLLSLSQGISDSVTNTASGTIIGDTLQIDAGAISNSGVVQAKTSTSLNATSLDNLTDTSKVIASTQSGAGSVFTVTDAVRNFGVLHGAGDLALQAGSLENSGTAAISSLGNLALIGTTGDFSNAGLLYGAGSLIVTNLQHAFVNSGNVASGVPASGTGDMSFSVDAFTNRGIVTSEGKILVSARDFRNEAVGALPQFVWGPLTPLATHDETACVRTVDTGLFVICVETGTYTMPDWTQIGDSGDFNCAATIPPSDCAHSRVYQVLYTQDQQLVGTMPTPAQLIANGDLQITYTGAASNIASVISGDHVTIAANGSGAGAFLNQDFHLERATVSKVIWERATTSNSYRVALDKAMFDVMTDPNDDEPGGAAPIWSIVTPQVSDQATILLGLSQAYAEPISQTVIPGTTVTAGIFARDTASYTGPALNVQAGMKSANVTRPDVQDASGAAAIEAPDAIQASGLNLSLPANPNGFFVPTKSSGAGYLIETNPLYTSGDALGSDYLAKLLGYNVDTLQKRLGDANYEAKLIREQLIAQTGGNILNGYANEQAQIKGLMDNASSEAGVLGLTFGKPLTADQAASLKQDLVWMEEKEISGQKVLVPVVYLAASTRDSVAIGAVVSAKDVSISGGALTNTNGTIKASEKLTVDTTGDITNRSGTISGGTVDLRSSQGNVVNETTTVEGGTDAYRRTTVGGTATISAKDGLSIEAAKDVTVKGGNVTSGGAAALSAGGNVTIDTIQNRTADSTASSSSGTFSSSSTSTNTKTTTQIGSNVSSGGDLSIRSGGDVTIGGSQVNAGGNADVKAGGNVNVVDRQDERTVVTRTESSGLTTDGASVGSESRSTTTTTATSTSVGSSVTSGGSANIDAAQSVNIRGSDVAAGGNLNVTGKDINVTAGTNTTTETVHEEVSSNMLGASADANSAGVAMTHTTSTSDTSSTSTTARGSTLRSGGDMTRNASGTITDVGTQIDAGGDFSQKATTIDSRAAANTQTTTNSSTTEKTSVGFSVDYNVGTAIEDAQNGSTAGASAASSGPTAGTNVKYRKEDSSSSSASSQAVTSTIRAGGKVTSQSSGTTTLEGTQIRSGGDTTLEAADLNVKAAKDTSTASSNSSHLDAGYRGAVDVTGAPSGTISAGYGDANSNSDSSKAVVGTITSGGNVNVRTKGDTRLEGTKIESKGDTNIDAGGTVQIDAARNTSNSASSSTEVSGSATVGKGNVGVSGRLETSDSVKKTNEAVTGSVTAGGNLNVRAGKDVKTEGTDLSAGKDAKVSAGGTVDMKDAVSTEQSSSSSLNASMSISGSKGSSSGKGGKGGSTRTEPGKGDPGQVMGGAGLSSSNESSSTSSSKASTVKAGGTVTVEEKGKAKKSPAAAQDASKAPQK